MQDQLITFAALPPLLSGDSLRMPICTADAQCSLQAMQFIHGFRLCKRPLCVQTRKPYLFIAQVNAVYPFPKNFQDLRFGDQKIS
jgi:hypothetical protein